MMPFLTQLPRDRLTLMAGPCMLESEELARHVIEALLPICRELSVTYVFKSSFDKANRTSANSSRGPGINHGLSLLGKLREDYQIPVVTDIHSPEQARLASQVADILQIPAFLCEDKALLQASAQTGRLIQVKKGQTLPPEGLASIKTFLDSVEGCGQVILCERGTSQGYHNLVVDFRNLDVMRNLGCPVVFDATHSVQLPGAASGASSGKREHVPSLARAAAAIGIDGLFMEVHKNPDQAQSDKDTQLTPDVAIQILQQVVDLDRCRRKWTV